MTLTHQLSSMLYEVPPTDPLTFAGVSIFLAGISMLANYLPPRNAAKADPMVALQNEYKRKICMHPRRTISHQVDAGAARRDGWSGNVSSFTAETLMEPSRPFRQN